VAGFFAGGVPGYRYMLVKLNPGLNVAAVGVLRLVRCVEDAAGRATELIEETREVVVALYSNQAVYNTIAAAWVAARNGWPVARSVATAQRCASCSERAKCARRQPHVLPLGADPAGYLQHKNLSTLTALHPAAQVHWQE
jgi:hypothetical protein